MQNYPDLYLTLSNNYGAAVRGLQIASDNIDEVLFYIVQLDNVEAKLDIMGPIQLINEQIQQVIDYSKLLPAVRALNHSSISRSGAADLNDYLSMNNLKICKEWADLCGQTGITVDPSNIDA